MYKKISIIAIIIIIFTVSSFAQFQKGDIELTLLGTGAYRISDKDNFYAYKVTNISLSSGFGKFISPNIQLGIQATWDYSRYTYLRGNSEEETYSSGTLGFTFFTNYNIKSESKAVPYLTAQYQISDILRKRILNKIGDESSLSIGAGLRYFVVEKAAINLTLLYNFPLTDAIYKYKTLSLLIGLSIII